MTGCSNRCSPGRGIVREIARTEPNEVPTHRAGFSELSILRVFVCEK